MEDCSRCGRPKTKSCYYCVLIDRVKELEKENERLRKNGECKISMDPLAEWINEQ